MYRAISGERNFIEQFNFSNRNNVRAPIQFRREGQPQQLKRLFFLKNTTIHFHINRTSVIRPVKQNQLSFPSIEIYKATSFSSQQCLVDQIHVQKPFKLLSQIRCLIMLRIESSIISIDSNITDNIRWLITKSVGPGMEP